MYKILSIDGGGILGIAPAKFLSLNPKYEAADLYAGTSTGSIIAALLADGKSGTEITNLYIELGKSAFKRPWYAELQTVWGLRTSKYSNKNFLAYLKRIFGEKRLGDLKYKVLIPTFNLETNKPKIQTNTRANDPDLNILVADAVARSCSAPTYFPSYQKFIDGGVIANNPSMCAIAELMATGMDTENIQCLSLGTYDCRKRQSITKDVDYGVVEWALPIVNILLNGPSSITEFEARCLLQDNFRRISFESDKELALDSVDAIPYLIKLIEEKYVNI